MGPFPPSLGRLYFLLAVDYVFNWVEATTCLRNDSRTMMNFVQKHIFIRFGAPRVMSMDEEAHFMNKFFESVLAKYGVGPSIPPSDERSGRGPQ